MSQVTGLIATICGRGAACPKLCPVAPDAPCPVLSPLFTRPPALYNSLSPQAPSPPSPKHFHTRPALISQAPVRSCESPPCALRTSESCCCSPAPCVYICVRPPQSTFRSSTSFAPLLAYPASRTNQFAQASDPIQSSSQPAPQPTPKLSQSSKMGMSYRRYLSGARIYGCLTCKTHLATIHSMISRVRSLVIPFLACPPCAHKPSYMTGIQRAARTSLPL